MYKKFLPLMALLVMIMTGCTTTNNLSRLTPLQQPHNANSLYPVEISFTSNQQAIRWDSVQANILVDGNTYPMRPVQGVPNRWEGVVPVAAGQNSISYRVKVDYLLNRFGSKPQPSSTISPQYTMFITEQ